jgi:septal ring factor EnvC (AmiA/AmiB activator)
VARISEAEMRRTTLSVALILVGTLQFCLPANAGLTSIANPIPELQKMNENVNTMNSNIKELDKSISRVETAVQNMNTSVIEVRKSLDAFNISSAKASARIIGLTWVLVVLTIVIVIDIFVRFRAGKSRSERS